MSTLYPRSERASRQQSIDLLGPTIAPFQLQRPTSQQPREKTPQGKLFRGRGAPTGHVRPAGTRRPHGGTPPHSVTLETRARRQARPGQFSRQPSRRPEAPSRSPAAASCPEGTEQAAYRGLRSVNLSSSGTQTGSARVG